MTEERGKSFRISLNLAKQKIGNFGEFLLKAAEPFILSGAIILILSFFSLNLGITNYYPFLLIGLIMFCFFRQSTQDAVSAISKEESFEAKKNKKAIILSSFFQALFFNIIHVIIFAGILYYLKMPLFGLVYYPVVLILYSVFIIGINFIIAGEDESRFSSSLWAIITWILLIITPIIYSAKEMGKYLVYNPLTYYINMARDILINNNYSMTINSIILIIGISLVSLILGSIIFSITKKDKEK